MNSNTAAAADAGGNAGLGLAIAVQPTAGLASVAAGKARYRGAAGFTGPDRFTVEVAAPSGKRSLAPVILLVGPRVAVEPEVPAPLRTLTVAHGGGPLAFDSFEAAYLAAQAGDAIRLNPSANPYPRLSLNRAVPGVSAARPVMVLTRDDADVLGVRAGGLTVAAEAARHLVRGIALGATNATIAAPDFTILRSEWKGWQGGTSRQDIQVSITGPRCRVGLCRLVDVTAGRGVSFDVADGAVDGILYGHLFKNFLSTVAEAQEPLQFGQGRNSSDVAGRCLASHSLWVNINQSSREKEDVSIKSGRNEMRFCHSIDARTFSNRHGDGNLFWGCRSEGVPARSGFVFRDKGGAAHGCATDGTFEVQSGDCTPAQWPASGQYVIAEDVLLVGNVGNVQVGEAADAVAARNTRIEAHRSGAISYPKSTGESSSPTTARAYPATVTLAESDVGPNAAFGGWPAYGARPLAA